MTDDTNPADRACPSPALDAPAERIFTDLEVAKLIARVLTAAARKVGIDPRGEDLALEELCRRIVAGAPGVRLDPFSYRVAWWVLTGHLSLGRA